MNRKVSRNRDWGSTLLSSCVSKPLLPHHPIRTRHWSPPEAPRMFLPPPDIQEGQGQPSLGPRGGDTFAVSYNLEEHRMTFLP